MKILIVEDDIDVAQNICEYFEDMEHEVEWAPSGLIGLERATSDHHDLIILDIALPQMSGINLCRRIRDLGFYQVPIIMLTARSELTDKLSAFDAGADDYIVKPFAMEELESRAHAIIRRIDRIQTTSVLKVHDLEYNTATQTVRRAGKSIPLTMTERKILRVMMQNTHRVLSRSEIEGMVWGNERPGSDSLRIHIHSLRESIDKPFDNPLIITVRGSGYRIAAPDETS